MTVSTVLTDGVVRTVDVRLTSAVNTRVDDRAGRRVSEGGVRSAGLAV